MSWIWKNIIFMLAVRSTSFKISVTWCQTSRLKECGIMTTLTKGKFSTFMWKESAKRMESGSLSLKAKALAVGLSSKRAQSHRCTEIMQLEFK